MDRLFTLQKDFHNFGEVFIVINGYKVEIRKVDRFVVSAGAVIIADKNNLIVRYAPLLAVFCKGISLVIRERRHIERGRAADKNCVVREDLFNVCIELAAL